ncbi:hypothetical protein HaLaN_24570 [Haematococcus lacustris]|uniref:Uncharacterized protein n=1 Tax=Haematococcus lacustris TaxID=44745 RepID=A0A6A0A317_HAELA|nr:hypothetical protein HaLaN_24570 [Haematococcus lacustris]
MCHQLCATLGSEVGGGSKPHSRQKLIARLLIARLFFWFSFLLLLLSPSATCSWVVVEARSLTSAGRWCFDSVTAAAEGTQPREYLKPRWRRQRLALHHAQERVIEAFCKKLHVELMVQQTPRPSLGPPFEPDH